ncbi:MAG: right-handed parallel beta-helix repeat-containing protein, partial [Armatimonadetes bacterium]|nr:right-handed parallel beta-helix repeat-containing protein [Armatimonadota bacterium]
MPKLLSLALCLLPLPLFAQQATPITSGMKIQAAVQLRPGTYTLEANDTGAIQVSGKGFTLDFKGVDLVGKGRKGVGLAITNAENVTIKNLRVSEFLWGVRLEKCKGVKFIDCVSSFNGDLTPGSVIDESGAQPEDQWGGGFLLRDSEHCHLLRCVAQYQWDGVDLVRSHHNTIEQGDNSYNGNWGIHLWNSSNNAYLKNKAIWCTTGAGTLFQALTGWSTMDAQAVGIDHNSNENLIEANDLRFGGDAIFIRANEGPVTPGTVVPPKNSSDRNILRNNDCSFSPNNAIEVDLVDGTIIEGNNCSFSNYGLWLGYSRHSVVRNNICIDDSTNAVEIENGQFNTFENNIFGYSAKRERPDGHLVFLRKNNNDKTPSQGYVFRNNLFYGARTGVLLHGTSGTFQNNTLIWRDLSNATIVRGDKQSQYKVRGWVKMFEPKPVRTGSRFAQRRTLKAGSGFWNLDGMGYTPRLVLLDGVPLWAIASGDKI